MHYKKTIEAVYIDMAVNSCRAIIGQQLTASRIGTVSGVVHCGLYSICECMMGSSGDMDVQ